MVLVLMTAACAPVSAPAQWLNYPTPGIPRTHAGKPDLSAPAPRASNGKPDLSGVWQVVPTPIQELERLYGDMATLSVPGDDARSVNKYLINMLADFAPQDAPIRPEAAALTRQHAAQNQTRPTSNCLPSGIPTADLIPIPFKIIQTRGLIVMLYEGDNTVRQIYTDGRKAPAHPEPMWLGYAVGHWDADTLVVDTVGFNDKSWLDSFGHPHSEALHVTERFRRSSVGSMEVQATIDDPQMYTKPFTITFTERLVPDSDILESFCAENEKDVVHVPH